MAEKSPSLGSVRSEDTSKSVYDEFIVNMETFAANLQLMAQGEIFTLVEKSVQDPHLAAEDKKNIDVMQGFCQRAAKLLAKQKRFHQAYIDNQGLSQETLQAFENMRQDLFDYIQYFSAHVNMKSVPAFQQAFQQATIPNKLTSFADYALIPLQYMGRYALQAKEMDKQFKKAPTDRQGVPPMATTSESAEQFLIIAKDIGDAANKALPVASIAHEGNLGEFEKLFVGKEEEDFKVAFHYAKNNVTKIEGHLQNMVGSGWRVIPEKGLKERSELGRMKNIFKGRHQYFVQDDKGHVIARINVYEDHVSIKPNLQKLTRRNRNVSIAKYAEIVNSFAKPLKADVHMQVTDIIVADFLKAQTPAPVEKQQPPSQPSVEEGQERIIMSLDSHGKPNRKGILEHIRRVLEAGKTPVLDKNVHLLLGDDAIYIPVPATVTGETLLNIVLKCAEHGFVPQIDDEQKSRLKNSIIPIIKQRCEKLGTQEPMMKFSSDRMIAIWDNYHLAEELGLKTESAPKQKPTTP